MDQRLWEECIKFHGHECPGLAIGYRAVEIAKEQLGDVFSAGYDEDIVCVTENDACGVDAIQWMTGCTIGKGNLIYRPSGKMAFSFFLRKSGKSIRLVMKPKPADAKLNREESKKYILEAPVDELFWIKQPEYELPEEARHFADVICDKCGEPSPDYKMHLQDGKKVCSDCFVNYDRGW